MMESKLYMTQMFLKGPFTVISEVNRANPNSSSLAGCSLANAVYIGILNCVIS